MLKLNFETITPLHISNGEELAYNIDYIVKDGYFVKLNRLAAKKIAEARIFDYTRNYKFFEVIRIIEKHKNIFDESCFDYSLDISEAFEDFLSGEKKDGRKIVQEFINSNGNFYIPGSSIKGMLTTILRRDVDKNPLGIHPKQGKWNDRFIITDSDFLSDEYVIVDRAFRPPEINLISLDSGVEFSCEIRATGNLNIDNLHNKLKSYSFTQLQKAKKIVKRFSTMEKRPGGATRYFSFLERLLDEIDLEDDEYLVNLGFGGGSYYKIYDNVPIPKFKNPGRKGKREEAHTTFSVEIDNEFYQLGWCKLKIEEE